MELVIYQLVWIGESLPAQNRYSELLLRESPSPPLLSVPPSQLLSELEPLPAALPVPPELEPLSVASGSGPLSLSPWGELGMVGGLFLGVVHVNILFSLHTAGNVL